MDKNKYSNLTVILQTRNKPSDQLFSNKWREEGERWAFSMSTKKLNFMWKNFFLQMAILFQYYHIESMFKKNCLLFSKHRDQRRECQLKNLILDCEKFSICCYLILQWHITYWNIYTVRGTNSLNVTRQPSLRSVENTISPFRSVSEEWIQKQDSCWTLGSGLRSF